MDCFVADDHTAIRAAVCRFLEGEDDIEVVGQASRGDDALARIEALRPDVAILDLEMPGLTGVEVARHLARSAPDTAVILYTAHGTRGFVVDALDAGIRGYVLKDGPLEDLSRAIRLVASGGTYVDAGLGTTLIGGYVTDKPKQLSEREREILRLLADGLRDAAIGKRLFISPETVRTHVRNATTKLEAETRTQAVATALRQSLIG